jgi:ubiquinone/menaquinone biosynthesis C-methylase UbiE
MFKKLLNLKFGVTAEEEMNFQKKMISSLKNEYINTDAVNKYNTDDGYKIKVDDIKFFIEKYKSDGYILDIGSNTCGESENLFHFGHKMVATDINEIALSYSKIRSKKFRNEQMDYFAIDAHKMPFKNETFDKVIAYEMLHHMEKIDVALKEMFKVLKNGGYFFTVEPYAYNPYRRISEVRDYFRGTIEKSFSVSKLKKLFIKNGFEIIELKKISYTYPEQKINASKSKIRKLLKKLYSQISASFPSVFGMIYLVAKKPGILNNDKINVYNNLICPETGEKLYYENGYYINKSKTMKYLSHNEIPVLINN